MNIGKWVHLSVDDVISCFKWIFEQKPESIFEEPMLGKLKQWHNQYKLNCDLYVFEKCEGFSLEQLQDCYWEELKRENHWLRLAWHSKDAGTDMENMKSGSSEEKEALDSLERTYRLITEKAGKSTWADVVRLHLWTGSFHILASLKKKNVRIFLTADRDIVSYHLESENLDLLQKQGYLWKDPFEYRKTDIRFDRLAEGVSVEDLQNKTEECFKQYPSKPCLELFFHEWRFKDIALGMDTYMEQFGSIHIPLFANAGVMVNKTLYFTTCNTYELYAMDVETERIEIVAALPYEQRLNRKLVSLCYFNNAIWMIPWDGDEILIYYLKRHIVSVYSLEFLKNEKKGMMKFRKVIEDGKYLWLLPSLTKCIVRIDMEKYSVQLYSDWPPNMEVGDVEKIGHNFLAMCKFDRKLYLFKSGVMDNIELDMDTGEMSVFGDELPKGYGLFIDKNKVLMAPIANHNAVRCYNLETKEQECFPVPEWIWRDETFYAYWYMKQLDDLVYIFPHEANALLFYDRKKNKVGWIKIEAENYITPAWNLTSSVGIYDAYHKDKMTYLLSYMANVIVIINMENNETKNAYLSIEIGKLSDLKNSVNSDLAIESQNISLHTFLRNITTLEYGTWSEITNYKKEKRLVETTGEKIYRAVKTSMGGEFQ